MHSRAIAGVVSTVLAAGAGCDAGGERCVEGDPAVVKQIMAGARTNFRPILPDGRPGIQVDHLELLDSSVGRLPPNDRNFGADQLLVMSFSTVLGGSDASDGFASVETLTTFGLDADGKLLGPADAFTASLFDLASPTDPGWLAWGEELVDATLANDLFDCVDPE